MQLQIYYSEGRDHYDEQIEKKMVLNKIFLNEKIIDTLNNNNFCIDDLIPLICDYVFDTDICTPEVKTLLFFFIHTLLQFNFS